MRSATFSDFLTPPLVRKFTRPPLLRLLTMSAFEGTPLTPLSANVINGSPLKKHNVIKAVYEGLVRFSNIPYGGSAGASHTN